MVGNCYSTLTNERGFGQILDEPVPVADRQVSGLYAGTFFFFTELKGDAINTQMCTFTFCYLYADFVSVKLQHSQMKLSEWYQHTSHFHVH